jgi:hypothetical protein
MRFEHGRHRDRLVVMKADCIHILQGPALDDYLRRGIAVRFEQYRIHIAMGFETTGLCLYRLRPADLAAIDGNGAVQGHVLWFERCNADTLAPQDTAQAGDERAFTGVRGATLDHQCLRFHLANWLKRGRHSRNTRPVEQTRMCR